MVPTETHREWWQWHRADSSTAPSSCDGGNWHLSLHSCATQLLRESKCWNSQVNISQAYPKPTKICECMFFSSKKSKKLSLYETVLMDIQVYNQSWIVIRKVCFKCKETEHINLHTSSYTGFHVKPQEDLKVTLRSSDCRQSGTGHIRLSQQEGSDAELGAKWMPRTQSQGEQKTALPTSKGKWDLCKQCKPLVVCSVEGDSERSLGKRPHLLSVTLIKHWPEATHAFRLTTCTPSQREDTAGTEAETM